MVARWCNG